MTVQRAVCSWCDAVLRDGSEPTTHGICPLCADSVFKRCPGPGGVWACRRSFGHEGDHRPAHFPVTAERRF